MKRSFVIVALAAVLAGCASFESIVILNPPARTVYGQGEEFDQSGMETGGVTKKGEVKPVNNSRIQISGYDRHKPGVQTVSVIYKETQTTLQIEVVPVQSISIEKVPALVKQYADITELLARANYNGRVPPVIVEAQALTLSGYNRNAAGRQTVTAGYYGKTAVFDVTVVEMSRLMITAPPAKVTYLTGENLNLEGIKATGTWAGIGDGPVTPRYIAGFDSTVQGQKTVVVEANGRQASFTVMVKDPVDPVVWTPAADGFVKNFTSIVYGNGKFAAAGYNDDKPNESIIGYSADGVHWGQSNAVNFKVSSIFFEGGMFFFAGFTAEGYPVIQASSNGIIEKYAYFTDFAEGASRCMGIAYDGDVWIAVFNRGRAAYSADGHKWNAIYQTDAWQDATGVFFNGKNFIALEASGAYRAAKKPASNWERGTGAAINGKPITGVVFGSDKWVGIGPDNSVGWSADGIIWTSADNIGSSNQKLRRGSMTGAVWGAGRFVAVNDQGNIMYSRDGYNWTLIFSSTFGSTAIRAVAYGNGTFVAVGNNGRIAYSRVVE
jgi:hypothetical protein